MNTKRILLTGGRAPATLHLARLFNQSSHTVILAETLNYALTKFSSSIYKCYKVSNARQQTNDFISELKEIIINENIDILIPTCEEIFYISMYKKELEELCIVFTEDINKLLGLHNKWDFIKKTMNYNLPSPQSHYIESINDITEKADISAKYILKPVYSRFSANIALVENGIINKNNLEISKDCPWLLQEFIEGQQYCSYAIAHNGEILAHSLYKTEFTAGQGATIAFNHIEHKEIEEWILRFVKKENFTGQIAFDFIVSSNNNVYAIECNPRLTSGIHLFTNESKIDEAFFNLNNKIILPNFNTKMVLNMAMLTYGIIGINSVEKLNKWINVILKSKDVTFSFEDPKPFFYQLMSMKELWKISKKNNISLIEASTFDIEWNGMK